SLESLADWETFHRRDRQQSPVRFHAGERQQIIGAIVSTLRAQNPDPLARTLLIVGPPGIGKTRTVIEALKSDPMIAARVGVATSVETAAIAIRNDDHYGSHPSAIVVVDDVPLHRLSEFEQLVGRMKDPSSALVILTPHSDTSEEVQQSRFSRIPLD